MTFRAGFLRGILLLTVWVFLLSGCTPTGSGPIDEEKEPHFLAGKERASTFDWKGAIECYEKALQVNPHSASAHFELGWIFDKKEPDPATAIYHYQHFLQLRPAADNADLAKNRINACKQALAETVSLGPINEKVQRQLEQAYEDNKKLTEDNKQLREELEKWSSYAARLQTLTNPAPVQSTPRIAQPNVLAQVTPSVPARSSTSPSNNNSVTTSSSVRTHTIKSGDTPSLIARKYGIKLEALMAANPNLDSRRLRVGQIVRIPGS